MSEAHKNPIAMVSGDEPTTYRYFRAGKAEMDGEDTFQVKMASEFPCEQRATKEHEKLGIAKEGEKYTEILSHDEGDVDLSRFTGDNRAALLDEHKDNRHLGYIKTASLSKDKTTRGVIVFDRVSKLSKTRCAECAADSRPNFSLGYAHTRYLGPQTLEGGKIGHRFAFQALELSNVAVPADPTAQKGRSKNKDCHCIRCGDIYDRSSLNDDFMCDDCSDAESPAEDASERGNGERMIRAKKDGKAIRISHNALKNQVNTALNNDKRFKTKRQNGDTISDFYTHDIHLVSDSADEYQAIVSSPAWSAEGKIYAVDFQYADDVVTLGDSTEVTPVTTFEAVDRGTPFDAKQFRADPNAPKVPVDFEKFVTGLTPEQRKSLQTKFMADTPVIDEKKLRADLTAELTPTIRTAVLGEIQTRSAKRDPLNKEIRALRDQFIKDSGTRWAGKPGEVVVVGERIRAFAEEALTAPEDHSDSEIRTDFKSKCNELIRTSREPKNMVEQANLDTNLASRCSLGRVIREGMKAADAGQRSNCFQITDGAEFEAHQEIHRKANDFPGGASNLAEGIQLPWNMPSGVRSNTPVPRLQRDALAGDFASAGALIAPEYIFPIIELLRNLPALSRAGMTILSGIMGNPVLPRQDAPTTAQSIAEGGALAQYDQVLGQIRLAPHRVGSSQKYSRLALLQTTPDFEAMVMADHMAVLALKIDYLGLNGQGAADEPLGVLNQIIGATPFAGSAANAYKNAVLMETAIRKANVPDGVSYITTSASRGMLKTVARLLVGATTVVAEPVWGDNETVNGRPAWDSQQVPGDVMLCGAFRHVVMAQWGGLAIVLDTISQANQDKYWLNCNTYIDFALRHSQAFNRTPDSLASLT